MEKKQLHFLEPEIIKKLHFALFPRPAVTLTHICMIHLTCFDYHKYEKKKTPVKTDAKI